MRDAYSSEAQHYIDLFAGRWPDDQEDTALVQRHLAGLTGPVLDLGCGPGHWTARLQAWGAEVTGVDMVPEFITHARAAHPGSTFRLGSMTELEVAAARSPVSCRGTRPSTWHLRSSTAC